MCVVDSTSPQNSDDKHNTISGERVWTSFSLSTLKTRGPKSKDWIKQCVDLPQQVLLPYLFICSSICPLFQTTVEDKVVCFVLVGIKLLVSVSVFVRWSR